MVRNQATFRTATAAEQPIDLCAAGCGRLDTTETRAQAPCDDVWMTPVTSQISERRAFAPSILQRCSIYWCTNRLPARCHLHRDLAFGKSVISARWSHSPHHDRSGGHQVSDCCSPLDHMIRAIPNETWSRAPRTSTRPAVECSNELARESSRLAFRPRTDRGFAAPVGYAWRRHKSITSSTA